MRFRGRMLVNIEEQADYRRLQDQGPRLVPTVAGERWFARRHEDHVVMKKWEA
jgi:hypothetical protein